MNCTETIETSRHEDAAECVIRMPLGLLGLEQFKRLSLLSNPEQAPFLWLQVLDEPKPAFLVISPFVVLPGYQPDIAEEDIRFLGLKHPDDGLIFNIVTVHSPQRATVNLKGPVLVNRLSLLAKQVIPVNAAQFSAVHPLPLQAD
jgi:flagellar assembly factor FliW